MRGMGIKETRLRLVRLGKNVSFNIEESWSTVTTIERGENRTNTICYACISVRRMIAK